MAMFYLTTRNVDCFHVGSMQCLCISVCALAYLRCGNVFIGQGLVMLHRYLTPAGGLRFELMVIALSLPRMSVLLRRFKFKFISLAVLQSCNLTL